VWIEKKIAKSLVRSRPARRIAHRGGISRQSDFRLDAGTETGENAASILKPRRSFQVMNGWSSRNTKAAFFHSLLVFGSLMLALQTQASGAAAGSRSLRLVEIAAVETVCAAQVPSGWIKVDDAWNPTTCGNPTTKTYNVWIIREYEGEPIGAVMTVCNGRAPAGWVVLTTRWNPTACSHPITDQKNVMVIQRLN
jgi:hypothetical protein